ncbi:hypothetical protein PIROE2DRAFT_16197 [Piromyces sp. E2]|nr:hypothetical protein PIROE2DRAFT_16197 [Piromyces sp. E2]|eukprot:OUM58511.1 hypothetical protein PIROE2DRAFT_16197 [Piromyces sp. E2]
MEVANFVLPAINPTNNNPTTVNFNKNDDKNGTVNKDALKNTTILKLPNTIVGHVKVDKNSKKMTSDSKDVLKNLVDTLIGSDNYKNRMRAMDVQRVISIVNEIEKKIFILNMIPKTLDVVFKIDIGAKAFNLIKVKFYKKH